VEKNFSNIAWNRIEAPGIHEDMLFKIKSLASTYKEVRLLALTDLFDMIWHQGSLSWSASFAVPFLIERLQQEPEPELLEDILFDLVHLGTGSSYCDIHQNLCIYDGKRNTRDFQEQLKEELVWVRATYEAVYKGVSVYSDLLEHDLPDVRIAAAYTLSCCKPYATKICRKMYARFRRESDELVKTAILFCLAFLSKNTPVQIAFFEEVLKSKQSDFITLSAGVALAYIAGEHMSDEALEILIGKIEKPNLFSRLCEHYENPMLTANGLFPFDFFTRLDNRQMGQIIPVLTKVWPIDSCADLLLYLVFGQSQIPEGATVYDLTPNQRVIIKAIADNASTGQEMLYRDGTLNFMGICAVSQSAGSQARDKLLGFLNGQRLEYGS
jgi:hypothetical protein